MSELYIAHKKANYRNPHNTSNWDSRITSPFVYKHNFCQNFVSTKISPSLYFRKNVHCLSVGPLKIGQFFFIACETLGYNKLLFHEPNIIGKLCSQDLFGAVAGRYIGFCPYVYVKIYWCYYSCLLLLMFSFSPFDCDSYLHEEYSATLSCVLSLMNYFDFCLCSTCVILLILKLAITLLLLLQPFALFKLGINSESTDP
jgi:hypothetical protein